MLTRKILPLFRLITHIFTKKNTNFGHKKSINKANHGQLVRQTETANNTVLIRTTEPR